jgi:hypothetical protein
MHDVGEDCAQACLKVLGETARRNPILPPSANADSARFRGRRPAEGPGPAFSAKSATGEQSPCKGGDPWT